MSEKESKEPSQSAIDAEFMKMTEQYDKVSELANCIDEFYRVVMTLYNSIEGAFEGETVPEMLLQAKVEYYISAATEQFGNAIELCSSEFEIDEACTAITKLFYNDREMRKNLVAKYTDAETEMVLEVVLEEDIKEQLAPLNEDEPVLDVQQGCAFYASQLREDLGDVVFAASIKDADE